MMPWRTPRRHETGALDFFHRLVFPFLSSSTPPLLRQYAQFCFSFPSPFTGRSLFTLVDYALGIYCGFLDPINPRKDKLALKLH